MRRTENGQPGARRRIAGAAALVAGAAAALVYGIASRRWRRRLEAARAEQRDSEARFHSIVRGTDDGIVIVDAQGCICFVNPATERLFERAASDLIGEPFGSAIVVGETTEMDILRGGERPSVIAELRASSTTWEGAPAQLIALRDITDRRTAEQRAQRLAAERTAREHAERATQRARFLAAAGATLDASLDPDVTLRSLADLVVPHFADWCVIDLVEGDGLRRVAGVHSDGSKQALLDQLSRRYPVRRGSPQPSARVLRTGEAEVHRGLDADRRRPLAIDAEHADLLAALGARSSITAPLESRERRLGTITFVCGERDFDDADVALALELAGRAAQALDNARLYDAALAANRAKSDFLAVMSHELRTPLNAILGYTQLLLDGVSGRVDDGSRRQLERVRASARLLQQIIEEILAYANMETGQEALERHEVRLGDVIDSVVRAGTELAGERALDFRVDVPDADATIVTDGEKVRHILHNLVSNAVKFTDRGAVSIDAEVADDELVVRVTDTGPGIAPDVQKRIFEPFWQAADPLTREAGGTGLGLAVAHRLATLLGGSIAVQSEPGSGSSFIVRLPAGNGRRFPPSERPAS